jgi:hypothetical protein
MINELKLPKEGLCPFCESELELDEEDQKNDKFICPNCKKEVSYLKIINDNKSSPSGIEVKKAKLWVGIIGVILILIFGIGSNVIENRTTKSLVTNHDLLKELGYDLSAFADIPKRLDHELTFLIASGSLLLCYLLSIIKRKKKLSIVLFALVFLCLLIIRLDSVLTLTEEQRTRGFTTGGWIGKIGSELIPFLIEMFVIALGWLSIKKNPIPKNVEPIASAGLAEAAGPQS